MWQNFFQGMNGFGDLTQMDLAAMYSQWAHAQNMQMNQQLQVNLQQLMCDPQFNQAYYHYRAQGGPMSAEQFAYGWMATAGYTPEGIRNFHYHEMNNQAREQAAWQGMRAAEEQRASSQAEMSNHYAWNQNLAGMNMLNQAPYTTPMGSQVMPYTLQPGYYRAPDGQHYFVDEQRNYFWVDQSGNRYPMQPQAQYPFH